MESLYGEDREHNECLKFHAFSTIRARCRTRCEFLVRLHGGPRAYPLSLPCRCEEPRRRNHDLAYGAKRRKNQCLGFISDGETRSSRKRSLRSRFSRLFASSRVLSVASEFVRVPSLFLKGTEDRSKGTRSQGVDRSSSREIVRFRVNGVLFFSFRESLSNVLRGIRFTGIRKFRERSWTTDARRNTRAKVSCNCTSMVPDARRARRIDGA